MPGCFFYDMGFRFGEIGGSGKLLFGICPFRDLFLRGGLVERNPAFWKNPKTCVFGGDLGGHPFRWAFLSDSPPLAIVALHEQRADEIRDAAFLSRGGGTLGPGSGFAIDGG